MMDTIEALCRKYTSLAPADIAVIQGMSTVLRALASWEEADIFVDCPCRDGDAIVVAEAKPGRRAVLLPEKRGGAAGAQGE